MSFAVQEQLLLALLFDKALREDFTRDAIAVLARFALTEAEKNDFLQIRPDGLELDASLRADLILSQMTAQFPLTFALLSSFDGGLELLKSLVDLEFITTAPVARAVHLGTRLRDALAGWNAVQAGEGQLLAAILAAELGMASAGMQLRQALADGEYTRPAGITVTLSGIALPVRLAPCVSIAVVPLPYAQLKQALCTDHGTGLWQSLQNQPVSAAQRQQLFRQADARLLLAQAHVSDMSAFDRVVDFSTVELAEGFAALFQYVDGKHNVAGILSELESAGAPPAMLASIKGAFVRLLENGMLQVLAKDTL